jgi:exodeoxyribonuclease-5
MFAYQGLFEEHVKREKNFATAAKPSAYRARINDNHVDFGWAITCHKSQGSQWDDVVVHDESGSFREAADQWLYTAITRAAERLVIVG